MATASGASSSTGSRGQPPAGGQPLCPFCKTATIVERVSRTLKNPDKPFYTCKNRDWANSNYSFFMWKPESNDGGQIATLVARLVALENSVSVMTSSVQALVVVVTSMDRHQSVQKWMNVGSVFVGVVCFVMLCMLMYKLA